MLTSEFSKAGLESEFRRIHIGHYKFTKDEHNRSLYLTDIAKKIHAGTFDFYRIKKKSIKNFCAYRTCKLGDELVVRRLSTIIRRVYRIKQADRTAIVKQVLELIREGAPKNILRLDISSFYESIDRERLIQKIRNDRLVSSYSIVMLEKFFKRLAPVLPFGLPRGIGISATLSELYLAEFDKKVRQKSGVYFYARYVDDIIIFANTGSAELQAYVEEILPVGMRLNLDKCRAIYVGCRCAERCIHTSSTCPCRDKCKCHLQGEKYRELDYVGYKMVFSDVVKDAKKEQLLKLSISENKIKRIKSRIVLSFLSYFSNRDFKLLVMRIKFLADNHSLKTALAKGNLKTGIRYNYSLVSDHGSLNDLKDLNDFFRKILDSRATSFGSKVQAALTPDQRTILKRISFISGFRVMRSRRLASNQVAAIRRCWKNAR